MSEVCYLTYVHCKWFISCRQPQSFDVPSAKTLVYFAWREVGNHQLVLVSSFVRVLKETYVLVVVD